MCTPQFCPQHPFFAGISSPSCNPDRISTPNVPGLTLWRFQPPQHKPLDLRSSPEITGQRTGHRLLPGTVPLGCSVGVQWVMTTTRMMMMMMMVVHALAKKASFENQDWYAFQCLFPKPQPCRPKTLVIQFCQVPLCARSGGPQWSHSTILTIAEGPGLGFWQGNGGQKGFDAFMEWEGFCGGCWAAQFGESTGFPLPTYTQSSTTIEIDGNGTLPWTRYVQGWQPLGTMVVEERERS